MLRLGQGNGNCLTVKVEVIFWLESRPEILFLLCGSEHPGVGKIEGSFLQVPFGGLPKGMAKEIQQAPGWMLIEDGDDYFTVPRVK